MSSFDKTLKDKNKREINLREYQIESVLPSFFLSEYLKLVSFLKNYYEYETRHESIRPFINDLFEVRDINQVDLDLLQWFEDDFLLGQNYTTYIIPVVHLALHYRPIASLKNM